jgi:hypothetical protein
MEQQPEKSDPEDPIVRSPSWWVMTQRVIIFLLGVVVVLDSLVGKGSNNAYKLLVGVLLIGFPSMDDLARLTKRRG